MPERAYAPPGWPDHVRPPGAPDWEASAVAYLFDCCPADFRSYPVLHRHGTVLARFAVVFVEAQQEAAERGLAEIRTILRGRVDPHVVGLVEEALLGRVCVPRMADGAQRGHRRGG